MTVVKDYPRSQRPRARAPSLRVPTPLGFDLVVTVSDGIVIACAFCHPERSERSKRSRGSAADAKLLRHAKREIRAYFAGRLQRFTLPLKTEGTPFERAVWEQVARLRFGEFASYADIARAVGRPLSHRGVARAMGRTPLDLLIPAHRVVGADGRPRGLSPKGRRAWLIRFEKERTSARKADDGSFPRRKRSAVPSPSRRGRTAR